MKNILITIFLLSSLSLTSQVWERVDGPYDYQFIGNVFKFNDSLCATSHSWKNINLLLQNGKWDRIKNGILSEVGSIYNCIQKDNVILLCTGVGSYRSYDYGENWEMVSPINGNTNFSSITIVNETIFAQVYYYGSSLYKLEKGSSKWEKLFFNDSEDSIYADRLTSYRDYIVTGDYDYFNLHKTGGGLTISSNGGKSWYKANFNKPVHSLIMHNGILFVSASDKHLYKSADYGKTWEVDTNKVFPVDFFYSDSNNLFAAVNSISYQDGVPPGIYISTDNGLTWERRHDGISTLNIRKLLSYKNILYCLDDMKHLNKSTNNGIHWSKCNILTDSLSSYDFFSNGDTLIVATSGLLGLYYSVDEGKKWEVLGNGFSARILKINKFDSTYALIDLIEKTLTLSKDYGNTWKNVDVGIFSSKSFLKDVELLGGDTLMIATIFGLRYSTDYGENWFKFHTATLDSDIYAQNILRIDENKLLLIVLDKGLYKSIDNGQTWEKVPTDFLTVSSTKFYTFEYLNGKVFAFLPNHGLFVSEDEGLTWSEFNTDMSKAGNDEGLIYYNGNLILAIDDGVIISNDQGKTVTYFKIEDFIQDSTYDTSVYDIEISGNYIYAGSKYSIYRAKLTDLGITPTSVESETERNYIYTFPPYPNPAKSEVKVLFYWDINLPMTADDISIYNLDGKKIATQGNLRLDKQANYYGNIVWDCSTAEPGIYLISIKHGIEERTVKVVVE